MDKIKDKVKCGTDFVIDCLKVPKDKVDNCKVQILIKNFSITIHPGEGTRLEGCRLYADLTSRALSFKRIAKSKLGTLGET